MFNMSATFSFVPFVSFVGTPAFSFAHESHQSHVCLSRLTREFIEVRRPNQAAPVNAPDASSWATSVVEVLGLVILDVSKTEREMTPRKSRLLLAPPLFILGMSLRIRSSLQQKRTMKAMDDPAKNRLRLLPFLLFNGSTCPLSSTRLTG